MILEDLRRSLPANPFYDSMITYKYLRANIARIHLHILTHL